MSNNQLHEYKDLNGNWHHCWKQRDEENARIEIQREYYARQQNKLVREYGHIGRFLINIGGLSAVLGIIGLTGKGAVGIIMLVFAMFFGFLGVSGAEKWKELDQSYKKLMDRILLIIFILVVLSILGYVAISALKDTMIFRLL